MFPPAPMHGLVAALLLAAVAAQADTLPGNTADAYFEGSHGAGQLYRLQSPSAHNSSPGLGFRMAQSTGAGPYALVSPSSSNRLARYESPAWGSFRLGMQSSSGNAGDPADNYRLHESYLRYTRGPLDMIGAYSDDRDNRISPDAHHQTWSVGGMYRFDSWRLKGGYLAMDDRGLANRDGRSWWLGADYRIGAHLLKAQYVENRLRDLAEARTRGLGIGYEYSLSRHATLYSALNYFRNQDGTGLGRATFLPPARLGGNESDLTQFLGGIRLSF